MSIVIRVGLIFLSLGLLFITMVYVSRIAKSYFVQKRNHLCAAFQTIVTSLVVNETFSRTSEANAVFEFRMAELSSIAGSSKFRRQVLIDQILQLKKNLAGGAVNVLLAIYAALHLDKDSTRKLGSFAWQTRAQGIRELTEMNCFEAVPRISAFLHSDNQILREESVMALIRLSPSNSLNFLDTYQGEMSDWMCINIHHHLQKIKLTQLPLFSNWFASSNTSVVLFCVRMSRHFRQTAATEHLLPLCHHKDKAVATEAIEALGELEAFGYRDHIVKLAGLYAEDEQLLVNVLQCLGKIGDPDLDGGIIASLAEHASYEVRFEAVHALKKLGLSPERIVKGQSYWQIEKIVNHLSEPLLQ